MEPQIPENVSSLPGPLPARMLNEFAYCPRLAYLMWVQGEWAESTDTVDGRVQHRRVNRPARLAGGEPKRRKAPACALHADREAAEHAEEERE
jgi:CRISPR-associated protein Cas1